MIGGRIRLHTLLSTAHYGSVSWPLFLPKINIVVQMLKPRNPDMIAKASLSPEGCGLIKKTHTGRYFSSSVLVLWQTTAGEDGGYSSGPAKFDYTAAMEWLWFSSELQTGEDPEAAVNWIFNVDNSKYWDEILQCTQPFMQRMAEIFDIHLNMKALNQTLKNQHHLVSF